MASRRPAPAPAPAAGSTPQLSTGCIAYLILSLILVVAQIGLYVHTWYWLTRVDKDGRCPCAEDWRRKYVLWFPPMALLASILVAAFAVPATAGGAGMAPSFILLAFSLLVTAGYLVFVIAALQYVYMLRSTGCTCAAVGRSEDDLVVYAYLPVVGWVLAILFSLAGVCAV